MSHGSVAWADSNLDGHLDILLTGQTSSDPVAKVYLNNGDRSFVEFNAGLVGVTQSSVVWEDLKDGDQRPEIVLTGLDASANPVTRVSRPMATIRS